VTPGNGRTLVVFGDLEKDLFGLTLENVCVSSYSLMSVGVLLLAFVVLGLLYSVILCVSIRAECYAIRLCIILQL